MKRKPAPPTTEIIPQDLLDRAEQTLEPEGWRRAAKCTVCSGECAPNSSEGLCWVCRRLKISAWRDSDPQMAAQE